MTNQEINHLIATQVNGWIHDEGIFYHDSAGFTCYLADYCNSISHALDIADKLNIALQPDNAGWKAFDMVDSAVSNIDPVAAKAICLTALTMAKAESESA